MTDCKAVAVTTNNPTTTQERMMKRGNRKKYWKQGCNISGFLFIVFALFAALAEIWAAVAFFLLMAFLDFRDATLGWKINYSIPERAWENAKQKDIIGEIARAAIISTLRAKNRKGCKRAFCLTDEDRAMAMDLSLTNDP